VIPDAQGVTMVMFVLRSITGMEAHDAAVAQDFDATRRVRKRADVDGVNASAAWST
jgi:hypothetical protein